jgi:hypothetical protein
MGARWTTNGLGDQTTCFSNGFQTGYTTGYADGYQFGLWVGPGFADGYNQGFYIDGYAHWTPLAFQEGINSVWLSRFDDGYWYCSPLAYADAYDAYVGPAFQQGINSVWQARFDDGYWYCSPLAYADAYDAYVGPAFASGYNQGHVAGITDGYAVWVPLGFQEGVNSVWLSRWEDGYWYCSPLAYADAYDAYVGPAFTSGYNQGHVAGITDGYAIWSPPAFIEGQNAAFLPRWQQGFADAYGTWTPLAFVEGQNAAFLPRWQQGFADAYDGYYNAGLDDGYSRDGYWGRNYQNDGYYFLGLNRGTSDAYGILVPVAFEQGQNSVWQSRYDDGYADGGPAGYTSGYNQGHVAGIIDGYAVWSPPAFVEGQNSVFLSRWKDGYSDGYGPVDGNPPDGYFWMGYNRGWNASTGGYDSGYADGYADGYDGYYLPGWADGYNRGLWLDGYDHWVPIGYDYGENATWQPQYDAGYAAAKAAGFGGVRNLHAVLKGVACTCRYVGADCTVATSWDADGYGNNLGIQGSGSTPTKTANKYFPGDDDAAIAFQGGGGKYYRDSGTTQGNLGTNDAVFELVFMITSSHANNYRAAAKYTGGGSPIQGWAIWVSTGTDGVVLYLRYNAHEAYVKATMPVAVIKSNLMHAMCFVDRSDVARWYINGQQVGADVTVSSLSADDISPSLNMALGAQPDGLYGMNGDMCYFSLWTNSAGWFAKTDWDAIVRDRYHKLLRGAGPGSSV